MKRCFFGALVAALTIAVTPPAFAQGGGASTDSRAVHNASRFPVLVLGHWV
jgi:hypothetical protein